MTLLPSTAPNIAFLVTLINSPAVASVASTPSPLCSAVISCIRAFSRVTRRRACSSNKQWLLFIGTRGVACQVILSFVTKP
jgi:hypothetical protein